PSTTLFRSSTRRRSGQSVPPSRFLRTFHSFRAPRRNIFAPRVSFRRRESVDSGVINEDLDLAKAGSLERSCSHEIMGLGQEEPSFDYAHPFAQPSLRQRQSLSRGLCKCPRPTGPRSRRWLSCRALLARR